MKKSILFLFAASAIITSCGEGSGSSSQDQKESTGAQIDMSGPDLEVKVLSFSVENMKTEIEVINRTDREIKSISGRMVFKNEDGEPLTTATGRALESPFSIVENPHVLQAKSKRTLELSNKLPDAVAIIQITEFSAETASGEQLSR